jgi:hypothetical protein
MTGAQPPGGQGEPWPPPPPHGYPPAPPHGYQPPQGVDPPLAGNAPQWPHGGTGLFRSPPSTSLTIVLWVIAALVGLVVVSSQVHGAFQTAHDIASRRSSPAPAPSTPALSQADQAYLDLIASRPPSITDRATLLAKGQEVCEYYRLFALCRGLVLSDIVSCR